MPESTASSIVHESFHDGPNWHRRCESCKRWFALHDVETRQEVTDSKITYTVTRYVCKHCGDEFEYGDLQRKPHWV